MVLPLFPWVAGWVALPSAGPGQVFVDSTTTVDEGNAFRVLAIPDDTTLIEAKSLVFDPNVPLAHTGKAGQASVDPSRMNTRIGDLVEERPNGMRCFRFNLVPGENLRVQFKGGNEGKIALLFLRPKQETALNAQIKAANLAPLTTRRSRIDITNVLDTPCQVAIMLAGRNGYPYALEIIRTPAR